MFAVPFSAAADFGGIPSGPKNWQHDLFQRARQLAAKVTMDRSRRQGFPLRTVPVGWYRLQEVSRILSSVIDQVQGPSVS